MTGIAWTLLGIIAVLTGIIFSLIYGKSAEKKNKDEKNRTINATNDEGNNPQRKRYVGGDGG